MKILPKSKKAISPPPQLAELISKLVKAGNNELLDTLRAVDSWKWPRSDLNAWIKVLNKFDTIMDGIIQEYNVEKLQLEPFSQETKDLLSEILRFERLLLENSTNRKTFSSYDRLNSLLSTSDLDVLILALNLLLRPSQQYSSQPAVSHALSISTSRLQSLSKRWPHLREQGISLVDLASRKDGDLQDIPAEAREVNFSFYLTEASPKDGETKVEDGNDVPMASPRKAPPAAFSSSAVHFRLEESTVTSKPVMNVLADALQTYAVPENESFELLCRIRVAAALSTGRKENIEKLVTVRLLAIAIFGHTHSESQATSALFLYEPDLIVHISELLHVDRAVPVAVQTAAVAALDALARYKNKVQEVLAAVNAGVNHGVLMGLVRNMVTEVANPDSQLPQSFVEAVLSFITYIASHASGGNMVVGAGLIPLLIQIMENRVPRRLPVISKTMQLVDNILYSFTNAFSLFAASRGVEVLVERIEYEIDLDIKEYAAGSQPCALAGLGELPIQRVAVLKHILRSMHRMMQSSGTAEGLRGLIDTSLLKSIRKIFNYRGLFGPSIFPLGINIMSTFVHNEPTSLAVIQEAGLPEVFYQAMEIGIEPAIEVIQAIPNAIGALCLNEAGLALLQKRPTIIPAIFAIFTSEQHLKVLIDKENAVIIGTAVDELIRHHPPLKSSVFEALQSTLSKIEYLGLCFVPPAEIGHWYHLIPTATHGPDDDVTMRDAERGGYEQSIEQTKTEDLEDEHEDEEAPSQSHDNIVVSYIDIIGRFLEGFFQHTPHCRDFVTTTDGLRRFGRLTSLPCLPYDFANSVASDSMVQVLRTMAEVATSETLHHLTGIVRESLDDTRSFWDPVTESSKLLPFVDLPQDERVEVAQQRFRSLVTLHVRITLLSDVFATAGQAQGRSAITLLQTLMNSAPSQVLSDLGALHRASIWENIALNAGLVSKGIHLQSSAISSPLEGSPNATTIDLPITESTTSNSFNISNGAHHDARASLNLDNAAQSIRLEGPRGWNASSLKHITQGLPNTLAPLFQAMVKMFHARRNPDALQKKQIIESSKILADIMLKHLNIKDFDDKALLYNYYSVIFALFSLLLVDERTSTSTVHTVELFALYQAGGFDAVFDICTALILRVEDLVKVKEEDRSDIAKKELLHAYGAIKVALHLIYPVVSSKSLLESGQTPLLVTRDKSENDPSYFEPHNFLVRLRSAALPTIRKLWEAPWLIQAPLGVSRYVVRIVMEIVNGENEEPKADPNAMEANASALNITRPSGPDEARIRILTDMGFPRSAAERALVRTHNNVNSATELLLSQPFPLPPDPVAGTTGSADAEQAQEVPPEESSAGADHEDSPEPLIESSENTTISHGMETPTSSVPSLGKSASEWRASLDEAREPLMQCISRQSLSLIDEHLSLLFDLHIAFTKQSKFQGQAVQALVEDVKAFQTAPYGVQEQPLANRCRLLALVLCENPASLTRELRDTLMDELLALLASCIDLEHLPKWLAAHLLVTEALFTLSEEPKVISLPKEGEPITTESIAVGPNRTEARITVFDFCLRLLAVDDLPADELLSVLRLFVLLTRDREMASQFVSRNGVVALFSRLRKSAVSGGSSYVATILRHIVEDGPTIQVIMEQAVRRYFTQARARPVDINTYVRNCSAIALRDVNIFLDTTKSLCLLEQPFSSSPQIRLQDDSLSVDKATLLTSQELQQDMQIDGPSNGPPSVPRKSVEAVISLLVTELVNTTKLLHETPSASSQLPGGQDVQPPQETLDAKAEGMKDDKSDVNDMTQYLCFLMQCLTELLFSYDACKVAFLSYSTKRRSHQTPSKEQNKFRNVTLHFLLSEMVTYGTINPSSDTKHRSQGMLCSWAMNVIGALCVDSSSGQEIKDVSTDLMFVRKFVLETLSRAIKETSSATDNMEARYGRLLALADLCHRLLTVRVTPNPRKHQEESPSHLAKIMLEKNFVAILTSALSEVDLNYPNVRNLVAAILRPLEYLTKVAIKMSRSSGKNKEQVPKDVSVPEESDEEEEGTEDDIREETPDLYRNSALGMFAGEMDDGQYSEDEDMEEDEDEQDVEMDYGEETGSEDTSASESDEEEGLEQISRDSEEGWDEGEDEDEEDLVENPDVDEDDEENEGEDEDEENEEDEGDDEEDEGMMWEDMQDAADGLGLALESVDADGGHGVPIQVNHEEDEPEIASDDEEYLIDHGHLHNDGILSFGEAFVNAGSRDIGGWFARRHRSNDHPPFGRSRNTPTAPEAITHPLLLDMSPPSRASNNISRSFRHASRIIGNGAPPPSLLQTIDEMLGQGSLQMLQQIISHEGIGPESFRIEVPAGTILHHGRRFLGASTRPERVSRPQGQRQGREFDPLTTLQRWAEETKILHGDFVGERVGKLANHVAVAMLPAAVEAIRDAKAREQEQAAQSSKESTNSEEMKSPEKHEAPEEVVVGGAADESIAMESLPDVNTGSNTSSNAIPGAEQDAQDTAMRDSAGLEADAEMADARSSSAALVPESSSANSVLERPATQNLSERVTVLIHGSAVDITDTGIDPTFLEALPDDMREEVLNQHVRDQQASRIERPPDSQISAEFLDALPPEIRAEIIQQEAMERARRRSEEAPRAPREAVDIDPASFIASLDPTLRQAVLLDQDDGFIQTLPSHMIAEAGAYRDELAPRPLSARNPTRVLPSGSQARKHAPQHDAIPLLDRAGVAVLVRLLFFPQVLKKNLLFKVLVNLCENSRTRTDLFNIILGILQDGTVDLAAVDKSFAQMSVRGRESKPQTPKGLGKQKATAVDHTSHLANAPQMETVPDLIAQRCLEALTYIVSTNEMSSLFFLTEHDIPASIRKSISKKGKGKEKQTSQTHYPLVLLLNLLDRHSLLRTPPILESVVSLLAMVTRPLASLKDQAGGSETGTSAVQVNTDNVPPEAPGSEVLPHVEANTIDNTPSTDNPDLTKAAAEPSEAKLLLPHAPQIPNASLRLIVNILTVGDCSGRTFQQSLALIQHLSYIPDARDVIAHELKVKAQEFGQTLYSDLDELVVALRNSDSTMISSVAAKFSSASSTQAKLLRVLKTIDYMYTPKALTNGNAQATTADDIEKVQTIYESFRFTPLWRRLGDCLSLIGEDLEKSHIAMVLLPLIESLMVVCKYVGSKGSNSVPRALRASASPRSPASARESMEELFISFTDAHRKILNLMVRNNPSLMSGSFSLLVNNSRVLDFDNKRNYFNQQLHRKPHTREHYGTLQLNVRRARVFEDSFLYLQRKTGEQIKYGKLSVRFYDEEGVDAGGLTREWFQILARQMFNPNNALFQPCAADKLTYQPNKNSWVNPEHLSFFKFVGRVIGKAIYDGRLLDAYFARSLYRQLLGKPVDYRDVEWVDPEYYNSLCWILENDPTALDLTFSVEADEFGVNRIVPLKEGGESIPVTQENKREFVQLSAQYRLYSSIKDQIESLSSGFYEIIPKDLISIFNEQELELLISGTPDIDVDEWRAATEYNGYTSSDPNIVWWWRALKSFNREERAKVLSFATGTSRVPLSGFVDLQGVQGVQKFSIHRAYGEPDRLPQAHTCFNQIDLPQYTSYEMLRQQLLMAINEGGEGFAFS